MSEAVMTPGKLIAYLNAINVGELDQIFDKLQTARAACEQLRHEELAAELDQARDALLGADLKTYRKRVARVISRLGHLR